MEIILLKQGRTVAIGSPEATLTPENILSTYNCSSELLRDSCGNLCLSLQSAP